MVEKKIVRTCAGLHRGDIMQVSKVTDSRQQLRKRGDPVFSGRCVVVWSALGRKQKKRGDRAWGLSLDVE